MNSLIFKKNFFFKENYKQNSPLIFYVGGTRTYKYIIKHIQNYIKKINANVIVSTWYDKDFDKDFIIKNLKPIYLDVEHESFHKTKHIFGKLSIIDKVFYHSKSTRSLTYKIYKTMQIINYLERKYKMKFEILIRSRLDIIILSKPSLVISKKHLYFEDFTGPWDKSRSDRYYYGHKKIMFKLINSFKKFAYYSYQKKKSVVNHNDNPVGEWFIKNCCDKYVIPSKPFYPAMMYWRKKSFPVIKDFVFPWIIKFKRIIKRKILRLTNS